MINFYISRKNFDGFFEDLGLRYGFKKLLKMMKLIIIIGNYKQP